MSAFRSVLTSLRADRPAAPVYVVAGRYDRAAIMREACKVARSLRAGGKSWAWRMSMGLTAAWRWARAAMAAPSIRHMVDLKRAAHTPATTELRIEAPRARVRVFHRGAGAHIHGW